MILKVKLFEMENTNKSIKTSLMIACCLTFIIGALIGWMMTRSINDISRAEAIEDLTGEPPRGSFSFQNHKFTVKIVTGQQLQAWNWLMAYEFLRFNNWCASEIVKLADTLYPIIDDYINKGYSMGPKRKMAGSTHTKHNTKANIDRACDDLNNLPWVRYASDWDGYWATATSPLVQNLADVVRDANGMKISVNQMV